jgi:methionyl-tRNA synthetase
MPSKFVYLNRKDAKIAKALPKEILVFFASPAPAVFRGLRLDSITAQAAHGFCER